MKFKFFRFFYVDSYGYTYLIRVRFTSSNKHAWWNSIAQAVTFGECELTKFALSCIRFGANLSTPEGREDGRLGWPE